MKLVVPREFFVHKDAGRSMGKNMENKRLDNLKGIFYHHTNMDKSEKLAAIYQILTKEYPGARTFLEYSSPFQLLVAVILSAQTTDNTVNKVTRELFKRYGTPSKLMMADVKEVESIIYAAGFYKTKAKNITGAAKMVVTLFNGNVPEEMEKLLLLPGVGRKSANVVRAHCFNQPSVIVDTHFSRVVRRLGLTENKDPEKIEKDILSVTSPEIRTNFSMVVNIHGRERCTAKKPKCNICVLNSLCLFSVNN